MNKDPQLAKEYLDKALKSMPDRSSMAEARTAMRIAMSKLDHATNKEGRKAVEPMTPAQKWNEKIISSISNGKPVSVAEAQRQLKAIEKMEAEHQAQMEKSKKGKNASNVATILG